MSKKILALSMSLGFLSPLAFAAADPDIASTTSALTSSVKDNVFAVISGNILPLAAIFAIFLALLVIPKMIRRYAR